MKPIKLEMDNFGPYRHVLIDFTKLAASPLFLISGKTGAGKTTFLRQLLRQYPLGEGEFRYGDTNVLDYQGRHFQKLIGYVPQDHVLFSRSVRENIAFGKDRKSVV